ncbi:hypothetical protein [Nonomuraea rubra]|uniref:Uncharacterized protein n=1 Tax=Nonomuraea rubra TaxID=46180 RepID=A0A7X0U320_9ACTN|nr:hypothetical protein [Nonomuraea rubra]MBB6553321.1 hypothetical protein [Nonomuraea rubra]
MNDAQQPPATGAPPPAAPAALEAIIEQARKARQHHTEDTFRRLGRGERLSAEQIYDTLHAHTVCTWWLLVARHIEYADSGGLRPAQAIARFISWIAPYATDPTPPEPATQAPAPGADTERAAALDHLERSLALVRQNAARAFLTQAETLAPACFRQQTPDTSAGQEATA